MKTLTKLEKSKSFWALLLISLLFFLLRLPSIIEPYWYGDEGIYEVIGQSLHQGKLLYTDIWDNKPPFLYGIFAFFNGNQESVRALSIVFGLFSTVIFFFLSQKLFKKLSSSISTTLLFAILFGTPFLEGNIANAENFMLLPILLAGLLIFEIGNTVPHLTSKSSLSHLKSHLYIPFLAGLLLGAAFLFKIVAIFDLAAFLLFFVISSEVEKSHITERHKHHSGMRSLNALRLAGITIIPVLLGFLIPLTLTSLYFLFNNGFINFIHATFLGNIDYVGLNNTFLGIPQGLLIFKLLLLLVTVAFIFSKRYALPKPTLFIILWLSFSLFNAFFSQRPYTHYLLVLLPSACLFIGLMLDLTNKKLQLLFLIFTICMFAIIKNNFWISNPVDVSRYYQNMVLFITGQKDVQSYRSFFDKRTPRDYEIASFVLKHTEASDDVFIWGDSAQIYALSKKLPINKYTVAYHIQNNKLALEETQQTLTMVKPKYIITLSETSPLPFSVPFYTVRFAAKGATIYERNF